MTLYICDMTRTILQAHEDAIEASKKQRADSAASAPPKKKKK